MFYGLDLFSGVGGMSLALEPWVRTLAYCESDRFCQAMLLSRMREGRLELAPIWDDVRTLRGDHFITKPDIIFGGFPCQDISVAGHGKGLGGKRSRLFYEILRLARELTPQFLFLENVPAIRTRGLKEVVTSLSRLRYDCRWGMLSASAMGAPHKRERWFLLAHTNRTHLRNLEQWAERRRNEVSAPGKIVFGVNGSKKPLADSHGSGNRKNSKTIPNLRGTAPQRSDEALSSKYRRTNVSDSKCNRLQGTDYPVEGKRTTKEPRRSSDKSRWAIEPNVGRVAHGVPHRVDRIRSLGNSVVPLQAREAFERLMGLK